MQARSIVRCAVLRDLDGVERLVAAFRDSLGRSRPTRAEIGDRLRRLLADPSVTVGVVSVDDHLLGYALQRRYFSLWSGGGAAVLEDVFVVEAIRQSGFGKRLVQHAITEARAAGCETLSLDTNERNAASTALYRGLGFAAERPRWEGGRQIRYDLRLVAESPVPSGLRWGPWMVKW